MLNFILMIIIICKFNFTEKMKYFNFKDFEEYIRGYTTQIRILMFDYKLLIKDSKLLTFLLSYLLIFYFFFLVIIVINMEK